VFWMWHITASPAVRYIEDPIGSHASRSSMEGDIARRRTGTTCFRWFVEPSLNLSASALLMKRDIKRIVDYACKLCDIVPRCLSID
jgi:hypothetical protein